LYLKLDGKYLTDAVILDVPLNGSMLAVNKAAAACASGMQ
jgi:hypothetical protein